jgi:aminoglycoside phosphotransferase (APT) family kinase protein
VPAPRGRDLERTREQLAGWLAARLPGARGLALSALTGPDATGFSNDTLLFDAAWQQDGRRVARGLVCRIEPTGPAVFPSYDVARQYRVMAALRGSAVPVPELLGLERDARVLGAPFFVMERVEGRIPSDTPPYHAGGWLVEAAPAERAALWESAVDTLAAVHRCEPAALGIDFLDAPGPRDDAHAWQLAWWSRFAGWAVAGRTQPTLEAALAWLRAHRPRTPAPRALCWGDARLGNMLFRDGRCAAVLDWEMATLGPPEMDLGWFLFMDRHHSEGVGAARLAGFPEPEVSVARWETGVGRAARDLPYYEVFAAFRFAAILHRLGRLMVEQGILPADSTFPVDNTASRLLARLLELPPPGQA